MALHDLREYITASRYRKELLKRVRTMTTNNQATFVAETMDQVTAIADRSERIGVQRERIRILNELTGTGPTGDFFEMPWDQLLAIITDAPRGR